MLGTVERARPFALIQRVQAVQHELDAIIVEAGQKARGNGDILKAEYNAMIDKAQAALLALGE